MFWFGGHIFAANSDGRLVLEEAPMNHEYADRRSTRADKHGRLCYKISKCFQGFFQNTFRWQIAHVGKVNKHVRRQGPPRATNPHRVIIAIRTKSETTSHDMISFVRGKNYLAPPHWSQQSCGCSQQFEFTRHLMNFLRKLQLHQTFGHPSVGHENPMIFKIANDWVPMATSESL